MFALALALLGGASAQAPPSMDDLWAGTAGFTEIQKFLQGDPALPQVNGPRPRCGSSVR